MSELPWFKFYTEAFTDRKFAVVALDNQIDVMTALGIWTAILCIAASSPIRGKLAATNTRGFTIDELDQIIGWKGNMGTGDLNTIIASFIDLEMIAMDDDFTFYIKNWEERQETKEEHAKRLNRERQERYRDSHKDDESVIYNVTDNAQITHDSISTSISISNSLSDSLIFNELKEQIEQLTGLPAMPQSIKAIDEIIAFGGTKADIEAGYKWLQENNDKPLKYYGQLVGPTRTAMSIRLGIKNGKGQLDRVSSEGRQHYGEWESK